MSHESLIPTVSETLTEKASHPVRDFLLACGVDVSKFPRVYFVIETPEKLFSNHQVFIPLRLPGRSGFIYESFLRVLRMMDVPSSTSDGKHRHFLELEWRIDENPLLETENHAAFSFISGDVECPSCRTTFLPDPSILDEFAIKIVCPSCMHYWTIRVDSPSVELSTPSLLSDQYYHKPAELKKEIARWENSFENRENTQFSQYFPHEFITLAGTDSLDWLFSGSTVLKNQPKKSADNFSILSKCFVNHLLLQYLKTNSEKEFASNLETTEISRKSKIVPKPALEVKQNESVVDELLEDTPIVKFDLSSQTLALQNEKPELNPETQKASLNGLGFDDIASTEPDLNEDHGVDTFTYATQVSHTPPKSFKNFQFSDPRMAHLSSFESSRSKQNQKPQSRFLAIVAGIVFAFAGLGMAGGYFVYKKQFAPKNQVSILPDSKASQPLMNAIEVKPEIEPEVKPEIKPEVEALKTSLIDEPPVDQISNQFGAIQAKTSAEEPVDPVKAVAAITPVEPEEQVIAKEPAKAATIDSKKIADEAFRNAYFRQGVIYMDLKQYDSAVGEFQKVIELDPKHSASLRNLGIASLYSKKYTEALKYFESFLTLEPEKSEDRETISQIVSQLKDRLSQQSNL